MMFDLRDKIIVAGCLCLLLGLVLVYTRREREQRRTEFFDAWDTLGAHLYGRLNRGS